MWSGMDTKDEDLKMQSNSPDAAEQLQEMFDQSMNLSNRLAEAPTHQSLPAGTRDQLEKKSAPFKYSISQHYTHTSHVTPALHPLQPSKQDIASRILIKNDIPPSALLRSQLTLFEEAEDVQRLRLIELWRIVPPTYARNGGQGLADSLREYQTTTMQQEEELAWLRYQSEGHKENASLTSNYVSEGSNQGIQLLASQNCLGHGDHPSASSMSESDRPCQRLPDHQYRQTPDHSFDNNDVHDEEML